MKLRPVPLLLLVVALAACGASSRQKTISTTLATVNAASDAFVAYDKDHRSHIVAEAKSHDEGQAALDAWDGTVAKVQLAIGAAYKAIATAATLNDDPSLAGMVQAALIVKTELDTLGITKAGGL